MAYSKQTWDTTSYVNPTRMNHIEQGIYDVDNKGWTALTVPTGSLSGNTYSYTIPDFTSYKFAVLGIRIESYDSASSETIGIRPTDKYIRDYTDHNGNRWCYRIDISGNTISITSLAGTFPANQFLKKLDNLSV